MQTENEELPLVLQHAAKHWILCGCAEAAFFWIACAPGMKDGPVCAVVLIGQALLVYVFWAVASWCVMFDGRWIQTRELYLRRKADTKAEGAFCKFDKPKGCLRFRVIDGSGRTVLTEFLDNKKQGAALHAALKKAGVRVVSCRDAV